MLNLQLPCGSAGGFLIDWIRAKFSGIYPKIAIIDPPARLQERNSSRRVKLEAEKVDVNYKSDCTLGVKGPLKTQKTLQKPRDYSPLKYGRLTPLNTVNSRKGEIYQEFELARED